LKTYLQCFGVLEPEDFELGKSNMRGLGGWGSGVRELESSDMRPLGDFGGWGSGVREFENSDMRPLGDFGLGESGLGKSELGEPGVRKLGDSGMGHLGGSGMAPLRNSGMGHAGGSGIGPLGRRCPGTGQITRQLSYSGDYEGSIREDIETVERGPIHHCSRHCIPCS
jgi:hypothetical protein